MTNTEITALRTAKGWTKVELARRLGVHWTTVWRWETSRLTPDYEHTTKMKRWTREAQRRQEKGLKQPPIEVDHIMACYAEDRQYGPLCSHVPCAMRRLAIAQDA